jgi:hypothetical protein
MDAIVAKALNAYIAASSKVSTGTISDLDSSPCSTLDGRSDEEISSDENKCCVSEITPHKQPPLKKQLVLQWKDEEIAVTECQETVAESKAINFVGAKSTKAGTPFLTPTDQTNTPKNQCVSPSRSNLNLMEYQEQVKKMERCVRSACEYELQLLNEAKSIRERRNRMVVRLKYMKRKVLRRAYLSSFAEKIVLLHDCNYMDDSPSESCPTFIDDFPLPPVFCQAPISIRRQRQIDL